MSFFGGNSASSSVFSGSPHADVLMASIPEDAHARMAFREELLRRAKGAVQTGNYYPDAIALYEKALEMKDDSNTNNNTAIVHANLSLCYGKIHNWDRAMQHAQTSTEIDPSYTKAWYRLAQAQAQFNDHQHIASAIEAMQTAIRLEPNNAALVKELQKLQQQTSATTTTTAKNNNTRTTTTSASVPARTKTSLHISKTTPSQSVLKQDNENKEEQDEDTLFKPSEPVRGYKIVNGKKTSYFHHELSEETKQLIGDIAPKKLDVTTTIDTSTDTSTTTTSTHSAWNQAQTWEEKDCTEWAKRTFIETVLALQPDNHDTSHNPLWSVTSVQVEPTSHASIVTSRGKKRYLYEFTNVQITWKYQTNDNDDDEIVVGTLIIMEIDGNSTEDDMDDLDITNLNITEWKQMNMEDNDNNEQERRRFILDQCREYFGKHHIPKARQTWVQLFHEMY
jgi:hypothetical protein